MKNTVTLSILLLLALATSAQTLDWAHTMGTSGGRCHATDMANDHAGNTYVVVGYFMDSVDLDPGPADSLVVTRGGNDAFVQRFNQAGELIWSRRFGGPCDDMALGVNITPDGMIWVAGQFCDSLAWIEDPIEPAYIKSAGMMDGFFMQLDSNGNAVIARNLGGATNDAATDIAAIPSGGGITAVAISGWFTGTADLDPEPSTAINVTSNGMQDGFVVRLNGAIGTSVNTYGGTGEDEVSAVHFNYDGHITATGFFSSTVDFDPDSDMLNVTSNGMEDIFVLRFHQATPGSPALYTYGGASADRGLDVLTDSSTTTWVTGFFNGSAINFDPLGGSAASLSSTGVEDAFLLSYETMTGTLHYAHAIGGTGSDRGTTLARMHNGNVLLAGQFMGAIDLDPGVGTSNFLGDAQYDVFVEGFDPTGNFVFGAAVQSSSSAQDLAMGLAVSASNQMLMCGSVGASADFDPSSGTAMLPVAGTADMFVLMWTPPTATSVVDPARATHLLGPNPTTGTVTLLGEVQHGTLTVTDLAGRVVSERELHSASQTEVTLPAAPGTYLLKLQTADGIQSWKVVKL
jgi:hypothetical protein